MKKLFAVLLALLMVLSFAACDEPEPQEPDGATDTAATLDFSAVMAGNGDPSIIWGQQDAATKQGLIDAGKQEGYEVSFGADGSTTVVDTNTGDTMIQKPDGTWIIQAADGGIGQYGGDWPENDFTKLLPKPTFALTGSNTTETEFSVAFQNATIDQIKSYIEEVKAKGFTVDAENEEYGTTMLMYTAKNADGYTVTVSYAMTISSLTLQKP